MINPEQLRYVKDQLAAGVAESTIRDVLAQTGYDSEAIEELLTQAHAEMGQGEVLESDSMPVTSNGTVSGVLPPVGEFFIGSWAFLKERPDVLGYMALLLLLLGWVPFVGGVVSVLASAIALYVALRPTVTFSETMQWMQENFLSYLWVIILVWLVVITGFTLLIIPGIVLAMYLLLAPSLRIEQGTKGLAALVQSTQLLYGVWWGTFGRFLLLGLSAGIVVAIIAEIIGALMGYSEEAAAATFFYLPEVISMAVTAIAVMVMAKGTAQIYRARAGVMINEKVVPASGTLRTLYLVFAWLGILAFIALMVLVVMAAAFAAMFTGGAL